VSSVETAHKIYFEDVQMNVPLETPGLTLTETHAALFGALTMGRASEPGVIPDLIPLCVSSGLGWRVPQPPLVVLAFMGFEWRFLKPTRVGDTIRSVSKTVAKRSMKEGGVVVEERSILNQHGEVVQSGRLTLLVAKRPAP
jgi:acyl dehydratase